jgi:hypothetical protein
VMAAPDVGHAVVGYRAWRVSPHEELDPRWPHRARGEPGRHRLFSLTRGKKWPARRALQAECRSYGSMGPKHRPPGSPKVNCWCGIYAYKTLDAHRVLSHVVDDNVILGEVNLWGRVIEHLYGWRAQCAYPRRLLLVSGPTRPRRRSRRGSQFDAMASDLADYGVPVRVVRIDLRGLLEHDVDGSIIFEPDIVG